MKYREYRNAAIVLFGVAVGLYILAAMAMLFAVLSTQNLTLFSAVGKFSDVLNALMVAVLASVFGNMALAGGLICFGRTFKARSYRSRMVKYGVGIKTVAQANRRRV